MSESNLKEVTRQKLQQEIAALINQHKTLQLASINQQNEPFASYAPFAFDNDSLYVLLSEIALHAKNLQHNRQASILIIEDESVSDEYFARVRVNYSVEATLIEYDTLQWHQGIELLQQRHGERIINLSQHSDFKLFQLQPKSGRYVKGFGRAYSLSGGLTTVDISHLRDGHKKRAVA